MKTFFTTELLTINIKAARVAPRTAGHPRTNGFSQPGFQRALGLLLLLCGWLATIGQEARACVAVYCPTNMTVNCASPLGTPVSFTVRGTNFCFPPYVNPVYVQCTPPSDHPFPPGGTRVSCHAWSRISPTLFQTNSCSFTVTVRSNCPPSPCLVVSCPTSMTNHCTSPAGTVVTFSHSASNLCTGGIVYSGCTPASGEAFPVGATPVDCYAITQVGSRWETNYCHFTVTILDDCTSQGAGECLALADLGLGTRPNPLESGRYKFESFTFAGASLGNNEIVAWDGAVGLWCMERLDIELSDPAAGVSLEIFHDLGSVTVEALDTAGARVDVRSVPGNAIDLTETVTVELRSFGLPIRRVRMLAPEIPAMLVRVCPRPLYNDVARTVRCWDLTAPLGPVENPWPLDGLTITATRTDGTLQTGTRIDEDDEPFRGYHVEYAAELRLASPCWRVRIEFYENSGLVDFVGYDDAGAEVAREQRLGTTPTIEIKELTTMGNPIRRVVVTSPNARTHLRNICAETMQDGHCADLAPSGASGSIGNPYVTADMTMWFREATGALRLGSARGTIGGEQGIHLASVTEIILPSVADRIQLKLRGDGSPMTAEAFDSSDVRVDLQSPSPPENPATYLELNGPVKRIVLTRGNTNAILIRLCGLVGPGHLSASVGPYSPLGNARLDISDEDRLGITNLRGVGRDGVSIALAGENPARVTFDQSLSASAMPTGATFTVAIKSGGQTLASLRSVLLGTSYTTELRAELIGSPTHSVQLQQGNQIVAARSGRTKPVNVLAQPKAVEVESRQDGQLRFTYEWEAPVPVDLGEQAPFLADRLDFITERSNAVPVCLCVMDLLWSGIDSRTILPRSPLNCLVVIVPGTIEVGCSMPGGTPVNYSGLVRSTNICTHTAGPPLSCVPPSGSVFPLGTNFVTCFGTGGGQSLLGGFRVIVKQSSVGNYVENPSFESVTTPAPAGGRPFVDVASWSLFAGEASIVGPGAFTTCQGVNYALLPAKQSGANFKTGSIQGRLLRPLVQGRSYCLQACLSVAGTAAVSGVWVEFVLTDAAHSFEETLALHWATAADVFAPPRWSHVAARAGDWIIVRTLRVSSSNPLDGRISAGEVRVDNVRLDCTCGTPGDDMTVGPSPLCPSGNCRGITWTGEGKLTSSTSLHGNAQWLPVNLPVMREGDRSTVIIPIDPNTPSMFFRLVAP